MSREIVRRVGHEQWHVDAEFAELLFPVGEIGTGLPAVLASGVAEPVKAGRARQTSRARVGGQRFYVKRYRGLRGPGHARKEWQTARRAFRAGLSTPRPVAACWQGAAAFVSLDAGGEQTLSDLVYEGYYDPVADEPPYPGHRPPELVRLFRRRRPAAEVHLPGGHAVPTPRDLARMIADLLIELHSLGYHHADLHPGNLLVVRAAGGDARGRALAATASAGSAGGLYGNDRADTRPAPTNGTAGDLWRLQVLDLLAMEEMPGREAVADHLVQLNHFFEPLATRSERFRVLKLLEARGLRFARAAARLEADTWAYRRGFYRGRDRRCFRDGKYFRRIGAGAIRGMAAADWADDLPQSERELARALEIRTPVKQSRREVSGFGLVGGRRVFIKRDTEAGWRSRGRPWPAVVDRGLRGTRQRRAWDTANGLWIRGIGTARPVAWVDVGHGLRGRESVLVSEALDGWQPLDRALPGCTGPAHTSLVETLAREIRRMHEAGVSNRDLKAQNILVRYDAARWRTALVDMVGIRRHRGPVRLARRMQDLMRLAFSWSGVGVSGQAKGLAPADRLRFLKTYLGPHVRQTFTVSCRRLRAEEQMEEVRRWWRGISFALQEKAARQTRRGR